VIIDPQNPFEYAKPVQVGILNAACSLLIREYQSLLSVGFDASDKNENKIRDELVLGANRQKTADPIISLMQFFMVSERPDLEENSRIDINIITPSALTDNGATAITIECKIVGENEYINGNGLVSFINGKYSSGTDIAGMIGFIKDGDITNKVEGIRTRLRSHAAIITNKNLERNEIVEDFDYSYESEHERIGLSDITMQHLFFDFVTA
jgi:hypothetical protein